MPTECLAKPELPTALANRIGTTINGDHSYWGVEITPAAPEFDSGFPDTIYIPADIQNSPRWVEMDAENGSTPSYNGPLGSADGSVKFYIISKNLNYAPVFDHRKGEWTNGIENNAAFSIEVLDKTRSIPNNPPWQVPRTISDSNLTYEKALLLTMLKCDPHTGLVKGELLLSASNFGNLTNGSCYVPVKLKIENGNGVAEKIVNLMLVDGSFPAQGNAVPQCDLPIGTPDDKPYPCEGRKTHGID